MQITLLYSTPNYHKLVEYAARNCYNSFDKCGVDSHKFIRGILAKGHLSITGHGNIVISINPIDLDEYYGILSSLVTFKEFSNYIRWTNCKDNRNIILSFNLLTFMDIRDGMEAVSTEVLRPEASFRLYFEILRVLMKVPVLRWFLDLNHALKGSENPFLSSDTDLLKPTVLSSDYTALKEAGLTDYELDVHSTITVEIVSDRAMSLQDARHSDMMGRSEISQRYVTMSDFRYRVPTGVSNDDIIYTEANGLIEIRYSDMMETLAICYDKLTQYAEAQGMSKLRAKEVARSVLPNNTYSKYIDTRPLKQWKHFFHLRDDKHAQIEKQQDAKALQAAFRSVGIPV